VTCLTSRSLFRISTVTLGILHLFLPS
jgi:hypothetical protein